MTQRLMVACVVVGLASGLAACSKEKPKAEGLSTPEATFAQVKKALVNRDDQLMWETLGDSWKAIFEKGRKELLAKPPEEKENIAREGMVSVADLEKMDTRSFFRFYFNYKKREVFKTEAPEIIEKKTEMIRGASLGKVEYAGGDAAAATKAGLSYKMGDNTYQLSLEKVGTQWLLVAGGGDSSPLP